MKASKRLLPVVAVLLVAAALRIVGAGGYPVWTDEGWSIWASSDPAQVIGIVAADRHPPLYFAALSLWRMAAGDSLLALRFLSIAAGVIAVAVVYRLACDVFGRRAALIAALLIAALPSAVYYAQEVRHYGWLTLFSALSWLILLRYLRRPGWRWWIGYVLSLAAMLYTLYFAVFTIAAQVVVIFLSMLSQPHPPTPSPLRREGERPASLGRAKPHFASQRGEAYAFFAAAMLYLPWLVVIATQQAGILGGGIGDAPNTIQPEDVLAVLRVGFGIHLLIPLAGLVVGGLLILRRPRLRPLALLIGGGGLLIGMVGLSLRFDLLSARTLAFLTPLLLIVSGYGLSKLDRRVGYGLAGVWVLLTLITPVVIQPRLHSEAAAQVLASAYQPGDAVILETGWDDNAFAYEVGQALPPGAEIVRTLPWTNERTGGQPVVPQVEPVLVSHARVWVVQWLQAPQVLPFLEGGGDGFQPAQTLDVSAGDYGARFGAPTIQVRLFTR